MRLKAVTRTLLPMMKGEASCETPEFPFCPCGDETCSRAREDAPRKAPDHWDTQSCGCTIRAALGRVETGRVTDRYSCGAPEDEACRDCLRRGCVRKHAVRA